MSLLAPRSHLLNDLNVEAYRRSVTEGVERVAASLTGATSPFTGVTPAALAPVVDAGVVRAPTEPGFGIEPRPDFLDEYEVT